ncbi:hypothetical protein C9I98_18165 [Photobacterium sanctipauli]|uniref:Uncharacterized protein n=1 Tax=Photobacterium sanctipauli TaxID=1342794 RepID=A0A2T3NP39_9GAMM|nr:hypothetical protein C9I98_18165 [Photobacterium sanctipauli]
MVISSRMFRAQGQYVLLHVFQNCKGKCVEQHFLSIIGFDYIIQFFLNNSTFVFTKMKKIEISLVQINFYRRKRFPLPNY